MIKRIVGRCHVGESYESVIRYVISRLKGGFEGYRRATLPQKVDLVKQVMYHHSQNRRLYARVMGGH